MPNILTSSFFFFKGYEEIESFLSRKRRRQKPIDYTPRNKLLKWNFVQEWIDLSQEMPQIPRGNDNQANLSVGLPQNIDPPVSIALDQNSSQSYTTTVSENRNITPFEGKDNFFMYNFHD